MVGEVGRDVTSIFGGHKKAVLQEAGMAWKIESTPSLHIHTVFLFTNSNNFYL